MTSRPGLELVTTVDIGHGLTALLYRRAPAPPPDDPWDPDTNPPPWMQDEIPALANLSPERRALLGLTINTPDGAA